MTNEGKAASKLKGGASPDASSSLGAAQIGDIKEDLQEILGQVRKTRSLGEENLDLSRENLMVGKENLTLAKENLTVSKESLELAKKMTDDLRAIMKTQKEFHQKLDDMTKLYLGDRESTCPKYIFIGEKNSSEWMKLRDALSTKVKIHVHFFCEADIESGGLHAVPNQQGIDISKLKDWFKKVAPWLRFSLAILYVAATTASNIAAPGLGLIIPNFVEWQQASTLANGIVLATGFTSQELDQMLKSDGVVPKGIDIKAVTSKNKQELRGTNRKIITELLGNISTPDLEAKLGLRKVALMYPDGSHRSVAWICNDCFEKYEAAKQVQGELPNGAIK